MHLSSALEEQQGISGKEAKQPRKLKRKTKKKQTPPLINAWNAQKAPFEGNPVFYLAQLNVKLMTAILCV